MPRRLHLTGSHAILRIKRRLEHDSFPRAQMSLIVGLTGAAGLMFSFVLLQLGDAADSPHWLESAVRRTALPFALTGVSVAATGAAMAVVAPDAQSIEQVMQFNKSQGR